MKILSFITLMLVCSASNAWWGGYGGFGGYGYGGYGYGYGMPYGMMGYGYAIPSPSFNYSTVINSAPPVIIVQPPANTPTYTQPEYYNVPKNYSCNPGCR